MPYFPPASGAAGTLTGTTLASNVVNSSLKTLGTLAADVLFTDNLYDIGANGATRPRDAYFSGTINANSISCTGQISTSSGVYCGSGSAIGIFGKSYLTSSTADFIQFWNSTFNGCPLIALGGATSSFPAFKRSSTTIQVRLADDSAFAPIQGKLTTDTNATTGLTGGVLAATTNASIVVYDASGQAYRIPCII